MFSNLVDRLKKVSPELDVDTKVTISIIASFATGVLMYLAIFNIAPGSFAGMVGTFLKTMFGRASVVLPIAFFIAGIVLIRLQKNKELRNDVNIRLGWGLFFGFMAVSGFLNLIFGIQTMANVDQGGGVFGYLVYPFVLGRLFGEAGSVVVLFCLFLIGFFLVSQLTFVQFLENLKAMIKDPSKFWDFVPDLFEFWKNDPMPTVDSGRPIENSKESGAGFIASKIKNSVSRPSKNVKSLNLDLAENKPVTIKTPDYDWKLPGFDILKLNTSKVEPGDIEGNKSKIKETLANFGIEVEMWDTQIGPTVTQYSLKPASGVRLSAIDSLQRDLALSLAASNIRIEAPIPGKSLVGVEIPNAHKAEVGLRDIVQTNEFIKFSSDLPIAIGKDVGGENVIYSLAKMPHLLVAGATGAGKSVFINGLLLSLLYRYSPAELQLVLVDMKRVELKLYDGIPHLLSKVITDSEKAINALKWTLLEMDRRYRLLEEHGKRNIVDYNDFAKKVKDLDPLPYIVFVIDELGDLMMLAKSEVEPIIVRLTQMSRAVGIHLALGTQRPDTNVVTGLIKANVPTRIAFTVASGIDSRVILDSGGAEKLLGQGDGLMVTPSHLHPVRFQGPFVSENEVRKCVKFVKEQAEEIGIGGNIREEVVDTPKANIVVPGMSASQLKKSSGDESYDEARKIVIQSQKASTSFLQQMMGVGYPKAAKIILQLEREGVVGPANGSKPRDVYISADQFDNED